MESGAEVIETVRQQRPDLVLLDIMLPGVSGFEICRRIRRDPELYTVPILAVSAMTDEEEVAHGLAQGADDYVTKPFDNQNLLRRLEMLLEIHATADGIDSLTQLPGPDITRREIQRRIGLRTRFALTCAELAGLREFGRLYGAEARTRAVRHFGRLLKRCGETVNSQTFFVGHMGGGYFLCLLDPEAVSAFCPMMHKVWQEHAKTVFGEGKSYGGAETARPLSASALPRVLLCVTICESDLSCSPKSLFETLAKLRNKGLQSPSSIIIMDQRCKFPAS